MKITETQIDQILEQGEQGSLDPSPYMENLKYLIMEDEDVDLTEEDQSHLIFLGTVCMEALNRHGLYRDVEDEEVLYDLEDANWEALDKVDGDLDEFMRAIGEDFEEKDLLEFLAYSVLPMEDEEEDEGPFMSSEDARILAFVRLKGMMDAILLPAV